MKMKSFLSICLVLAAMRANATTESIMGIGFTAPNVNGTGNVGNPEVGDIIFETGASEFKGYSGSGWLTLGATSNTPPTYSKVTTSSHTTAFSANGTGTYTPPSTALYIRVRMVGAGGGGGGSGTATFHNGQNGYDTTFGSGVTQITAGGGTGGVAGSFTVAAGGTTSLGSSPIAVGTTIPGSPGASGTFASVGSVYIMGGAGGGSPFYGGGAMPLASGNGGSPTANSGSGGAGGSMNTANTYTGGGGGSGGFVDAIFSKPGGGWSTFAYTVGAGQSGGAAGTSGFSGSNGADGVIEVSEYYQ